MNALEIDRITVYNKIDQDRSVQRCDGVMMSCVEKQGITELIAALKDTLGIEDKEMDENSEF